MIEILQSCIPIIVGALIAIVPTLIEKRSEQKNDRAERLRDKKKELYVELVTLFGKVLKEQHNSEELDMLRNRINLISITGSAAVVKTLNEYIDTWGSTSGEEQNRKYSELLKVMRVDLGIDKMLNEDFPEIGLRYISVKHVLDSDIHS